MRGSLLALVNGRTLQTYVLEYLKDLQILIAIIWFAVFVFLPFLELFLFLFLVQCWHHIS